MSVTTGTTTITRGRTLGYALLLLRIKVNANGSYSIPAGNMFAPGTARTRPEIYAMGFRNPFRMSVDKATGVVYVGDYGPDAGATSARGPQGQVEFNRVTGPGFYGWPYCTGANTSSETYAEWDFATNSAGPKYNCSGGPTNNSFRNTGLSTLPSAKAAWIRYAGDAGSPPEFGDGTTSTAANPTKTYNANGNYTATLTVRDPQGATGTANVRITVGNTAPTVTVNSPAAGELFAFGDTVPFTVTVTDPEDGAIDCAKVKMTYVLGHDNHGHQITSKTGCSGTITIPVGGEHDDAANIFAVFDAEYTDNAGLTTHTQHILQPKHRQAEHYTTSSGVATFDKSTAEGGKTVGNIENGDWIAFQPYKLNRATSFSARVSSGGAGGTLQVRAGSATGTVLGSAAVPATGSWETFTTVNGTLAGAPAGTTTLYLTFTGGSGYLFDLDAFTFNTGGTTPGSGPMTPGSTIKDPALMSRQEKVSN